ncbi:hypothetical protein LZ24_00972 [Desulfobotulus alkaliphilus]|uniref:Uncharacterized protein n=1 Tax=Desulfobotulus alkaliphilus TaxID=622671 RepID=A0A562RZ01_9BACT|nr:hypothetical protein [Desulfobotulus alkaliphilus]TWI74369.1 hypothetical protein LZ24_00972 [Desulfobotulus alkaliphilus]
MLENVLQSISIGWDESVEETLRKPSQTHKFLEIHPLPDFEVEACNEALLSEISENFFLKTLEAPPNTPRSIFKRSIPSRKSPAPHMIPDFSGIFAGGCHHANT